MDDLIYYIAETAKVPKEDIPLLREFLSNDIDSRLTGMAGYNQFHTGNSPVRGSMSHNFASQAIPIINPDKRILLSGLEQEMTKGNFNIVIPKGTKVYAIIPYEVDGKVLDTIIIYQYLNTAKFDMVKITSYEKNDSTFSFDHKPTKALQNLEEGTIFNKETKLTTTNSDLNGQSALGKQLNVLFTTDDEVSDDPFVISDEAAKGFAFYIHEEKTFTFGTEHVPKNMYGDDNEYKIIPDIGEKIRDDGIIAALMKYDENEFIYTMSNKVLQRWSNTDFTYNTKYGQGEVVDIRVHFNPQRGGSLGFSKTYDQVNKYYIALKEQRQMLIDTINEIYREFKDVELGHKLHVEATNAMLIEHPKTKPVYNRDSMEVWKVTVVVKHLIIPNSIFKFATLHGHKGVAVVRPADQMPVDKYGNRVDMIIDANSVVHRMNIGNKAEGFLAMNTKVIYQQLLDKIGKPSNLKTMPDKVIEEIFDWYFNYLALINPDYKEALKLPVKMKRKALIQEVAEGTPQVLLADDNKISPMLAPLNVMKSEYCMEKSHLKFKDPNGEIKYTHDKMWIENLTILMLYKIGQTWLGTNSHRINLVGCPIAASKAYKSAGSFNEVPVKFISETEGYFFSTYSDPRLLAELRDRTLSPTTHKEMYKNILTAEKFPLVQAVDRKKFKYGGDLALQAFRGVIKTFGETLVLKDIKDEDSGY